MSNDSDNALHVDIFTIFPDMFDSPFRESIVSRAIASGRLTVAIHDIRDWTHDRHRSVDDRPYGGGAGMIMMAPPIVEAVEQTLGERLPEAALLLMSPAGTRFDQAMARSLARRTHVVIICGRYEGVDARVETVLDAESVSIGDYVLTGGELPAMVIVDAVARLLPGVIREESVSEESHEGDGVEYPQYTRPADFRGDAVPEVLMSGNHQRIREWRHTKAAEALERRNEREALRRTGQTE